MQQFPCYQCEKRYIGCHAQCKSYLDAKEANEKLKEKAKESYNPVLHQGSFIGGNGIKRHRYKS